MKKIKLSDTISLEFSYPRDEFLYALEKEYNRLYIDSTIEVEDDKYVLYKYESYSNRIEKKIKVREVSEDEYKAFICLKQLIYYRSQQISIAQRIYKNIFESIVNLNQENDPES